MLSQLALEFIRTESVPTLGAIMLAIIAIVTAGHRE